jgi:hypothetical protein
MFVYGLLEEFVGVVLRLVVDDVVDADGDGGERGNCQPGSSCRFTMDTVCWREKVCFWGAEFGDSGKRQGEWEECCIAAEKRSVYQVNRDRCNN